MAISTITLRCVWKWATCLEGKLLRNHQIQVGGKNSPRVWAIYAIPNKKPGGKHMVAAKFRSFSQFDPLEAERHHLWPCQISQTLMLRSPCFTVPPSNPTPLGLRKWFRPGEQLGLGPTAWTESSEWQHMALCEIVMGLVLGYIINININTWWYLGVLENGIKIVNKCQQPEFMAFCFKQWTLGCSQTLQTNPENRTEQVKIGKHLKNHPVWHCHSQKFYWRPLMFIDSILALDFVSPVFMCRWSLESRPGTQLLWLNLLHPVVAQNWRSNAEVCYFDKPSQASGPSYFSWITECSVLNCR